MKLQEAREIIKDKDKLLETTDGRKLIIGALAYLDGHAQGVAEQKKRAGKLVEALENIRNHIEYVAGKGMSHHSATFKIADEALSEYNQTQDKGYVKCKKGINELGTAWCLTHDKNWYFHLEDNGEKK